MKIAIVTNILTPYRRYFFDELSKQLLENNGELKVYAMTEGLPLRPWLYENLKTGYTELVPGFKFCIKNHTFLINISVNRYINLFNPDIVIMAGSWTYPTSWFLMMRKRYSHYYFWTESHNVRGIQVVSQKFLISLMKKIFYRRFDGYCIPGQYATDTVNEIVGNYGERVYLPNLVDNVFYEYANVLRKDRIKLRKKYNLSTEKRIFITPARLISIKGVDIFLEHIKDLTITEKATFILAGEGPLEKKFKELCENYKLDLRLMGYCNQETIRDYYAIADFFLLPSLVDPNPLTVIEAAFSGLPLCISHYVGNSPELGLNKENGVVFDTQDYESVKDAFEYIMNAPQSWISEAGNKSRELAYKMFRCNVETKKLLNYFSEIV